MNPFDFVSFHFVLFVLIFTHSFASKILLNIRAHTHTPNLFVFVAVATLLHRVRRYYISPIILFYRGQPVVQAINMNGNWRIFIVICRPTSIHWNLIDDEFTGYNNNHQIYGLGRSIFYSFFSVSKERLKETRTKVFDGDTHTHTLTHTRTHRMY